MIRCSGYAQRLMWRDIAIVVQDLARSRYKRRNIAKMFGLRAPEIHGMLVPKSRQASITISRRQGMTDPTDNEIAAIQAASEPAGEYLESLGKTDLASMDEAEWLTLIEVIVTAYTDRMIELGR